MSSYIESPFVIEQRRLQGIVNQCQEDLKQAINQVENQIQHMKEMALKQRQKDDKYYSDQQETVKGLLKKMESEKKTEQMNRNEVESYLQVLEIQIHTFQNNNGGLEMTIERHRKLRRMIDQQLMSADKLMDQLKQHGEQTSKEMMAVIKQRSSDRFRNSNPQSSMFLVGQKGVSLHVEEESEEQQMPQDSPLTRFAEKMQEAFSFSYAQNTASFLAFREEFNRQPDYSKAAFAVRNMDRLDQYIEQFKRQKKVQKDRRKKWERLVKQYYAICRLLEEEPKNELTVSIEQAGILNKHYQELCHRYQEIKEKDYVFKSVSAVMERHGIMMTKKSEAGAEFALDDTTSVNVSGNSHRNLSMEVCGSYFGQTPTLNDRRKAVTTAKRFCSVIKEVEAELKNEYGIIFKDVWTEEPSEETISMINDSSHSNTEHRFKENNLKERSLL